MRDNEKVPHGHEGTPLKAPELLRTLAPSGAVMVMVAYCGGTDAGMSLAADDKALSELDLMRVLRDATSRVRDEIARKG